MKRYRLRRAANAAIDLAREAHETLSYNMRTTDRVSVYVSAAMIRLLTPIIMLLFVTAIVTAII